MTASCEREAAALTALACTAAPVNEEVANDISVEGVLRGCRMILRVHPQSRLANQRRFGLRAYPQPKKAKCSARTTTAPRSCLGRGGDLQSSKMANEPEGGRGLRASGRKEARHIQPPPKRSESIFVALVTPLLAPPCAVIGPSAARRRGVYAPEAPMARR